MTSEQGKRGFTIASVLSLVLGVIVALWVYGSLLDVRSLNVIGLVYILVLGLYALYIAVSAGAANRKNENNAS